MYIYTYIYKLYEFIFGSVVRLNTLYWAVNKQALFREKLILLSTGVISYV